MKQADFKDREIDRLTRLLARQSAQCQEGLFLGLLFAYRAAMVPYTPSLWFRHIDVGLNPWNGWRML